MINNKQQLKAYLEKELYKSDSILEKMAIYSLLRELGCLNG